MLQSIDPKKALVLHGSLKARVFQLLQAAVNNNMLSLRDQQENDITFSI